MTHIDLFTGIGGFSLAAARAGFETIVQCEYDDDRRYCLDKTWNIPIFKDVREFDGFAWRGATLLTAGVPCQPASLAGKRRGADDDRWLWPEAIRITAEARPTWALFENPPGILTMGIDGILADLEGIGYSWRLLNIPACAVNSPQRRHRIWIMAHCSESRLEGSDAERGTCPTRRSAKRSPRGNVDDLPGERGQGRGLSIRQPRQDEASADANRPTAHCLADGEEKSEREPTKDIFEDAEKGTEGKLFSSCGKRHHLANGNDIGGRQGAGRQDGEETCHGSFWDEFEWVPCLEPDGSAVFRRSKPGVCGLAYGLPAKLRNHLLAALGDAIVPHVATEILGAVAEVEREL